jgi:hypothetical protein
MVYGGQGKWGTGVVGTGVQGERGCRDRVWTGFRNGDKDGVTGDGVVTRGNGVMGVSGSESKCVGGQIV